jgi:hypothetical protein
VKNRSTGFAGLPLNTTLWLTALNGKFEMVAASPAQLFRTR